MIITHFQMMTNIPLLDGSSNEIPIPLFSDEQLKDYLNLGHTVSFPSPHSETNTFASDSEGVVENLLENGEEIMKDLVFKKIFDSYLKPRDFPGEKKLDIKLVFLATSISSIIPRMSLDVHNCFYVKIQHHLLMKDQGTAEKFNLLTHLDND